MAMSTDLFLVSKEELESLQKEPQQLFEMERNAAHQFGTHFACCINYFLTGDAYGDDSPLGSLLFGDEQVQASQLENGEFGINSPGEAAKLSKLLHQADLSEIRREIQSAQESDWEGLDDAEVDDLDVLLDAKKPVDELMRAILGLKELYAIAAEGGLGVVMYTS